jgi:hypothetical protein
MTACLGDRTLWALSEGDGSTPEREHLEECGLCAHRVRHLHDDLAVIGRALRGREPAVAVAGRRPLTGALAWGLMGASLVTAFLAVFVLRPEAPRSSLASGADGVTALAAISRTVFAEEGRSAAPATDLDVVATAFTVSGPCEWEADGCGDESEPLY